MNMRNIKLKKKTKEKKTENLENAKQRQRIMGWKGNLAYESFEKFSINNLEIKNKK